MPSEKLEHLITEYGNACFDCGEWDGDDEPFDVVLAASEKAKTDLMDYINGIGKQETAQ